MTYELSGVPVACGSCTALIPHGQPVYRVTSARLPRCSSCVARMGLNVLSASEANQVREAGASSDPPDFARLRRLAVPAKLRGNLIEWRSKQAGE